MTARQAETDRHPVRVESPKHGGRVGLVRGRRLVVGGVDRDGAVCECAAGEAVARSAGKS